MGINNESILDVNGNLKDFTFVLSTRDYRHLGILQNVDYDNVSTAGRLSTANEFSIVVYKTMEKIIKDGAEDIVEPLWNDITDLKTIFVPELNEYYDITVQLDDSADSIKKTITAKSLCESELSQVKIYGLEINTEQDISRDDYVPTIFYDEDNPSSSLLNRALSFMPQYRIMHVDKSLCNIQRSFSVDGTPIYDWFTGECANEFHCLFVFNSTNRGVYVYDLYTVCEDCGHRAEFMNKCQKCNGKNLKYFGEDVDIFIDKENLTDSIQLTYDSGSVKNCFKLVAGDDIVTSTVRLLNPNGSDFIYKPTDVQLAEMPEELRSKIVSYNQLYDSVKDDYEKIVSELYESINKIDYYTHTMMPTIEHAEVTAKSEADKLTQINLSPLGLSSVTTSTNKATVESALKNYARVYIKTGYVKLDINSSEYNFVGKDSNGWNYGTWKGNFKVTNYSNEEDIAYSPVITVKVTDDYQTFLEQKIMKNISTNSDEEDSVFDVLNIDELSDFTSALKLYSLNRLKSFYDAVQSALDVLIEVDQANEEADLYESFYLPYYNKLQACQTELDARQKTIDEWQNVSDNISMRLQEMQAEMNFRDYLGEDLYKVFCLYRREETYQNDNYISDGLSDSEIIAKAKEFLEVAERELEKARTPKISITTTLYNLMLMPEFKPLMKKFRLGNWFRIRVDGIIYRLMLIGYDLTGSSSETITVEFANVTKLDTLADITGEILDKAQSMSSTYNYITNQANKGNLANNVVNNFVQEGLDSALITIKSSNNNKVTTDKHGITISKFDDIMEQEDPEKARITYNLFCYTKDNWKTVETALGKHKYYRFDSSKKLVQDTAYGLSSTFVTAGYIYGSQIISGEIFSENYTATTGSYLNLKTGAFTLGANKLVYDPVSNKLKIKGVDIEWSTSTTPEISDIDGLTEDLAEKSAKITANANAITLEVQRATESEGVLSTRITQNANDIVLEANKAREEEGKLSASIKINADTITSEVSRAIAEEGKLSASIKVNTDAITSEVTRATKSEETLSSLITQNASNIELKVSKDSVVSSINQSAEQITINAGKISLEGIVTANNYFKILQDGSAVTTNLTVNGGSININNNFIVDSSGNVTLPSSAKISWSQVTGTENIATTSYVTGLGYQTAPQVTQITKDTITTAYVNALNITAANSITANSVAAENITGTTITGKTISGGSINIGNGTFYVSSAGAMSCTSATINGKLTAWSGSSIGAFSVDSNSIFSGAWGGNGATVFMSTGTTGNYTIAGTARTDWGFGAGGNFGVTQGGYLYTTAASIGGSTLQNGSITTWENNKYVTISPSGITNKASGTSTMDGIITAGQTITSGKNQTVYITTSYGNPYILKFTNGILTSCESNTALASTNSINNTDTSVAM